MEAIKVIEKEGYKAEIFTYDDIQNPREWCDHLGTMVCFHKRYKLGDYTDLKSDNFNFRNGWDDLESYLRKEKNAAVILPLYLYDHSGITMNTTGFSCPWDSGQVGFIYASRETVKKEYGLKRNILPKTIQKVKGILEAEVKGYDQYLTGDVYGIKIFKDMEDSDSHDPSQYTWQEIDSCWGFFGMNFAEEQANEMLDSAIKNNTVAA